MKKRAVFVSRFAARFAIWLAILAVVLGVRGVTQAQNGTSTAPAPLIHEVRAGESLWSIATLHLGSSRLWPLVYRANRDQIMDPARLFIGQRLNIPRLSEEEKKAALRDASLPQELKPVLATPEPAAQDATPASPAAVEPAVDSSVGVTASPPAAPGALEPSAASPPADPSSSQPTREVPPPAEVPAAPASTPSENPPAGSAPNGATAP